jgi:hypothetical protein
MRLRVHQTDGKKEPRDNLRWGEKIKKEARADPRLLNSYFNLKLRKGKITRKTTSGNNA